MKTKSLLIAAVLLAACSSFAQRSPDKSVPPGLEPQLKQFFAEKKTQAKALAKIEGNEQMPQAWDFFAAGENGDWTNVTNIYGKFRSMRAAASEGTKSDSRLLTIVWRPIVECFAAYEQCANMDEKYVTK